MEIGVLYRDEHIYPVHRLDGATSQPYVGGSLMLKKFDEYSCDRLKVRSDLPTELKDLLDKL